MAQYVSTIFIVLSLVLPIVALVIIVKIIKAIKYRMLRVKLMERSVSESVKLHAYVVSKCERSGVDSVEAQSIANNYAEDFKNECGRRINKYSRLATISKIRSEFESELDTRFRNARP